MSPQGHLEGAHAYPKHVYANPKVPQICPILALAIHYFTRGFREVCWSINQQFRFL